ncbi:cobalamin-dependent protein, partial [Candidatus Bathyarchaeota archaeon]|nr:cobalamin-dependent protein [Candidatus Bathyarchaeota archaeon]
MSNNIQTILEDLRSLISTISDVETVKETTRKALASGAKPLEIVDVLSSSLNDVGKKYDSGEYFLSELMMAGILASEVTNIIKPHLTSSERKAPGKIVIGTVKGDLHDIGKNIVIMMLSAAGFEIVDLGVDVPAEKFVETAKKENANILGMSALLSSTMDEMKNVIQLLTRENVRSLVKVIVGGRPVTADFATQI